MTTGTTATNPSAFVQGDPSGEPRPERSAAPRRDASAVTGRRRRWVS